MTKTRKAYLGYLIVTLTLCLFGLYELNRRVAKVAKALSGEEERATRIEQAIQAVPEPPSRIIAAPVTTVPKVPVPISAPAPADSATFIVPPDSATLVPLEGWVDQPNKDRPGRVHTNLMIRRVTATAKPKLPVRAPCLKPERRPAERIKRSYGWVSLPARTIHVPCTP